MVTEAHARAYDNYLSKRNMMQEKEEPKNSGVWVLKMNTAQACKIWVMCACGFSLTLLRCYASAEQQAEPIVTR